MRRAVVAGSFDPPTIGHLDLIIRATEIFDEVIVGVGVNSDKPYGFWDVDLRVKAIENSVNVRVEKFSGLLVDFCKEVDARWIVRGVRPGDFDYEYNLATINSDLDYSLQTVLLPAHPALQHISSSYVRTVFKHKGLDYIVDLIGEESAKLIGWENGF